MAIVLGFPSLHSLQGVAITCRRFWWHTPIPSQPPVPRHTGRLQSGQPVPPRTVVAQPAHFLFDQFEAGRGLCAGESFRRMVQKGAYANTPVDE